MKRCSSTGDVNGYNDSDMTNSPKRSRKNCKSHNRVCASQPSQPTTSEISMDDIIDSVAHPSCPATGQSQVTSIEPSVLLEIAELRSIVKLLSDQVSFLLSYVGVVDTPPPPAISVSDVMQTATTTSLSGLNPRPTINQSTSSSSSQSVIHTNSTVFNDLQDNPMSYASAVQHSKSQLSNQLRQAVVSAVYVDLHSKTARENNIIVSGLPAMVNTDDKDVILELIHNE